jgi:tetratricopeptide (TPR) repeat protein
MLAFVLLVPLFFQAPPAQAANPALVEAQTLIDQGDLSGAETQVRAYVAGHPDDAQTHYLLAYILFRRSDPKASLAEYAEAAKHSPPGALDLAAMGSDYFLLEDYPSADKALAESVRADPGNASAWYYLGRTRYNEKRFADSAEALHTSLKLTPGNARALDYLGLSYEGLGKIEDALSAYQAALATGTKEPGPYLDLGTLLTQNNRPAEGVPHLEAALRISPQDPQAHRELGKAYLLLNRLPEARAELEKASELSPENAPVHFLLAQVCRKLGLADKAQQEASRYAALTGAHSAPDTPLAEARSLLDAGKPGDAERVVRAYLAEHKNSADGHYLLGYVLFKEQRAKDSLAEYTEAARYRTPRPADLEVVASDYVLLKDYPDADKWYTKAVEWNPEDALGWYYLGRTKYNENRFDEAVAAFERCLKLQPKDVKAEDNLGLAYEGLNRTEEAMAAYRQAIEWQASETQKNAGPYLDLGSLLVETGKATEGLPHLRQALAISPGDFRVHRQLGKAYTRLNDLEKARAELEKAIELAPDNAPIHSMLAQVYRRLGLTEKAKLENERYAKLTSGNSSSEN